MTDDLVKRLRDGHVCSIAQNSCRNGYAISLAADRIEALTAEMEWLRSNVDRWEADSLGYAHNAEYWKAENERLNKSAACLAETRRLAVKDVAELEAENERLLQIAQRLGTYSAHDDGCRIMTHGVWSDPIPCTCGYTDAWQALAALEKQP